MYCHHLVVGTVRGGGGVQGAVAGGAGEASPVVVPTVYTQPLSLVHCTHRSEASLSAGHCQASTR